jgi:hypothetical protein
MINKSFMQAYNDPYSAKNRGPENNLEDIMLQGADGTYSTPN